MARRHVLVDSTALSATGGGKSYTTNLLRELNRDDRGFDFTFVSVNGGLGGVQTGRFPVLDVSLPSWGGALPRVLYEQLGLPRRARRFDLLFCPADLLPMWGGPRTVVFLRNLNIYDRRFYDTARTRLLDRLVRVGVSRARRVLFASEAAADQISGFIGLPPERVRVVPHGISLEAFEGALGPPETDARYLFLPANLERHKNFETLFEALRRIREPDLELWLAGGSSLDPEWALHLRSLVRENGIEDRVRFLGPIPYANILGYYRGAAALVFPSLLETFGFPLLEAMLAGTPIVASDLPVFSEIAGDVARYFPKHDAAALAEAVERTLRDSEDTQRRLRLGRDRVQEFSWKHSIDGLCRVFDEALDEI